MATTDMQDKIVVSERDPSRVSVDSILTARLSCARSHGTHRQAGRKMRALGIHHLLAEDSRGSLIGMKPATDIFIAAVERGWEMTP